MNLQPANVDPSLQLKLTACSKHAERAFERAFDLQQAGAPVESVNAALAELGRLQLALVDLEAQIHSAAVLH
jgi:hypothetical protein